MRRSLSLLALLLAVACVAQPGPTAPVAPSAATLGRVSEGPTVTPSAVLADLDAFAGKFVRLEGKATAVCQRAGCWMDVADERGSIRIKVRDGVVVFPFSAKGKRVIAEGTIAKIPVDPATDPASCGGGEGHDCARPAGAAARLDGVGATVFEGA